MNISDKYVYLIALIPFCIIWTSLYSSRKDLRKEMFSISVLIGVISVLTSYFWWTKDWWKPQNITGTIVGIEDFIMGFTSGGIMSIAYNYLLKNGYSEYRTKQRFFSAILLMIFMVFLMFYLLLITGLTSFWSCVTTLMATILFLDYSRKDLLFDSLISGVSMMFISMLFYLVILLLSNTWVDNTYLQGLSGIRFVNIPIEEFVFWFLAGMWIGPFYEYVYGKKLEDIKE